MKTEKETGTEVYGTGSRYIGESVVTHEDLTESSGEHEAGGAASPGEGTGTLPMRRGSRYADKREPQILFQGTDHVGSRYADNHPKPDSAAAAFLKNLDLRESVAIAGGAVAGALVIGYTVLAVYFGSHFYPGTRIGGADCSRLNAAEAAAAVQDKAMEYTLTIGGRDGVSSVLDAQQIGLRWVDNGVVKSTLKKQKSLLWPIMMAFAGRKDHPVETVYSTDRAEASFLMTEIADTNHQMPPCDAYVGDAPDGSYMVIPEVPGSTLKTGTALEAVQEALRSRREFVSLEVEGCFENPKVSASDPSLQEEAGRLNTLLGANITYTFGDRTEVVDSSVIKTFISEDYDGNYYVDDAKIADYVAGLAAEYDTYGGYRTFTTSTGETVELSGGDYGWEMDQGSTADILSRAIMKKVTATYEPEYYHTAMSRGINDIGDSYVEVCISSQTMWCYENGELLVETPVVTGNPNLGRETPSNGVWSIDGKMEKATLVGENYRQPVDYWIPFNGGVGIHDLQSRGYYGGDIYQYAGSHGCVNTPLEAVRIIYDAVSYGEPVIVYD